jgi:hypothetical protein
MLTQQSKPTMKGNADDDDDEFTALIHRSDYPRNNDAADQTLRSYTIFSFLFAANPSAALACLSLATARLGSSGALSSGVLYLTYTLSSVMGATYVVKKLGSRNAMIVGMSLYCCYVGCFWAAVSFPNIAVIAVISGAFFGGIGAGILWTVVGSFCLKIYIKARVMFCLILLIFCGPQLFFAHYLME